MSDFNIEFEENDQQIKLEFEQIGGGAVKSVNGKTGVVVLDADDVGAYTKPSGGIPKTDLASAVQTSLGKADSAYQKPSGGIPANDIASGVIPTVDSTLAISGAAADAKKTGDEIATVKDGLTAVEDDVADVKEDLSASNNGVENAKFVWEVGTINNGSDLYNATAYRTVGYYDTEGSYTLTAKNTLRGGVYYYNSDKTYANKVDFFNQSMGLELPIDESYPYYRMSVTGSDYSLPNLDDLEVVAPTKFQKEINTLNEKIEPIDEISEIIGDNFTEQYISEIGTTTASKYINSSGNIADISNSSYSVTAFDAAVGDKFKITGFAGYSGYFYAFYNSNDEFISGHQSGSGASTTITDEMVVTPTNATKLVVAGNRTSPNSGTVKKSIGYISNAELKWVGKKWTVVGDSLTAINSRTTKHYFDYVAEATGITVVNMGDSGSGYRAEQDQGTAFYQRISDIPLDSDVVTIFGSFNDGISDIGTATDTGTTTVGGCVNATLDNLYEVFPTVQLGIVSPTPWVGANPYNHSEANAYAELLEDICKRRSIPFLNLYYESNLRPWDSTFRTLAYSKDDGNGVHPDETGHKIIASRFLGFLDSLLT